MGIGGGEVVVERALKEVRGGGGNKNIPKQPHASVGGSGGGGGSEHSIATSFGIFLWQELGRGLAK